jgi:hypothetical protein
MIRNILKWKKKKERKKNKQTDRQLRKEKQTDRLTAKKRKTTRQTDYYDMKYIEVKEEERKKEKQTDNRQTDRLLQYKIYWSKRRRETDRQKITIQNILK